MSKPLGRDRLGRLVYAGDLVRYQYDGDIKAVVFASENGTPVFHSRLAGAEFILDVDEYEVDFSLSPKHTNYERYFADLGTMDQVEECSGEICKQYDGKACIETSCPFCWWSLYFRADGPCLESFASWLKQEATV